jgi:hypothetical protein
MIVTEKRGIAFNKERNWFVTPNDRQKRYQTEDPMSNQALQVMQRDYLRIPGNLSTPLFGQEFEWMFRLSRPHFELMVQDVFASKIPFSKQEKYVS